MEEKYMKIEVLGTGCAKCKKLYENARQAVEESGKTADVVKVEDMPSIMKYGVMSTPALVVDGEVRFSGKVASVAEIVGLL
jgi:small redox-active disulfide protein 2